MLSTSPTGDNDYLMITFPDTFVPKPKAQFVAIWSQLPKTVYPDLTVVEGYAYARKWELTTSGGFNVIKVWSPKQMDLLGGPPIRYMLNLTTLNDLEADGFTHPTFSGKED